MKPIAQQRLAFSAVAGLAALATLCTAGPAAAQWGPEPRRYEFQRRQEPQRRPEPRHEDYAVSRQAGAPLMAVVALGSQRVTIYDADGKIFRAPVSSGKTGYETPAGIYSIIQKNREHYSNLYDDASMPFMQRITWSGIALHAGALPGRPASHGCVRLPYTFAEQLFDLTKMGMRVVVVRDDMSPVDISHPTLFKPGPIRAEVAAALPATEPVASGLEGQSMRLGAPPADGATAAPAPRARTWRAVAAAKTAEAEAASRKADDARRAASKISGESARLTRELRRAEGRVRKMDALLQEAERIAARAPEGAEATPATQRAEELKTKAKADLAEAQAQYDALQAEAQPKIDAAAAAREEVKAAEAVRVAAQIAAKQAENKMAPVSVLVSLKTQRLYVRQAFKPIFETPITISNPETPIGTTIYTALSYTGDGSDVRWSALAMYPNAASREPAPAQKSRHNNAGRGAEAAMTDPLAAKAALDRISIPQEAIERISEVVSPGSTLIISDEEMSRETGTGTDFIVVMSGEPQGGIKTRRRGAAPYSRYDGYRRSPYGNSPFSWW